MIDWDALVLGPALGIFGEPVTYRPADAPPFAITAVFDEGYSPVELLGLPAVMSARPQLGVRLREFPAGFVAEEAQGDQFTVERTGITYVVRSGQADSHGHVLLEANLTP